MADLVEQLRQLRLDLAQLIDRDPEQEVTGQALLLIDAVVAEARLALPETSTLGSQVVEIISPATIEAGEPVRAADALVIVGQLLAVLGAGADEGHLVADRRLLGEFRELLPSTPGAVEYLKECDLGAAFRWEWFDALDQFVQQWDNAEHLFNDHTVEAERRRLLSLARSFLARLALESSPEAGDWQAVVPARYRDTFRLDGRQRDIERVDELNLLAAEVYKQHQTFLRVARHRLAC